MSAYGTFRQITTLQTYGSDWVKTGHDADIANVKRFSLLFARRFPVTPKLFPVNFREHFRREPAWMLRLATISFLI